MSELLYEHAIKTVRSAGEMLVPHFGLAEITHTKSDLGFDIVTKLDHSTEQFIEEELRHFDPDIGFLGEECGEIRSGEWQWICDPIDGTAHFVRGLPFCTTQLALVKDGKVVFSVINNFITQETFVAKLGGGSTKNNTPIRVSNRNLRAAYMPVDMKLDTPEKELLFLELNKRTTVTNIIAGGHEMAMVASGRYDGRIAVDPYGKVYDYAPGCLLVSEAGGIVRNIGSDKYHYRNTSFLAVNPVIYKELTTGPNPVFPF